jgi:hypothetical protein
MRDLLGEDYGLVESMRCTVVWISCWRTNQRCLVIYEHGGRICSRPHSTFCSAISRAPILTPIPPRMSRRRFGRGDHDRKSARGAPSESDRREERHGRPKRRRYGRSRARGQRAREPGAPTCPGTLATDASIAPARYPAKLARSTRPGRQKAEALPASWEGAACRRKDRHRGQPPW